ncbi:hypothetical protein, partial [Escherichia coli]|uniref:hypothetical protein n=1 Tax=Escherichia coli TaxID=562 RepID=UPI0021CAB6E9
ANMLLGYKFLQRPIEQLAALYDEGPGFMDVRLENSELPANRRRVVEGHLNTGVNLVIQRSERMYNQWRANIGDATING